MSRHRKREYCVIDKNAFDIPKSDFSTEVPELVRWFNGGKHRIAVITDYALQESISGDSIENMKNSLYLIKGFPEQLACTKTTMEVGSLNLKDIQLDCIFDHEQTRDLQKLCMSYSRCGDFPLNVKAALRRQSNTVHAHLNKIAKDPIETHESLRHIWQCISKYDIAAINEFMEPSDSTKKFLIDSLYAFSNSVQQAIAKCDLSALNIDIHSSLSFKFALASIAQRMDLLRSGPPQQLSPSKVRNNIIDANYVAYGLIFKNFMTNDRRAKKTFRLAKWLEKHFPKWLN